jgi:pimeloyl-CoA synthetase
MSSTVSDALKINNMVRTHREILDDMTHCLVTAKDYKKYFTQFIEPDPSYSFRITNMKSVLNSNIERIEFILDSFEKNYVFRKDELFKKTNIPVLQAVVCRARLAMIKRLFEEE